MGTARDTPKRHTERLGAHVTPSRLAPGGPRQPARSPKEGESAIPLGQDHGLERPLDAESGIAVANASRMLLRVSGGNLIVNEGFRGEREEPVGAALGDV